MTVEELLSKKGIYFVSKGKDVLVKCFNPEHEDSSPSMRIDREDGVYHCFSCGFKGNLFKDCNVYRNIFGSRVRSVLDAIGEVRTVSVSYPIPDNSFNFNKMFRGISAGIMSKFGAFTNDSVEWENRIIFPLSDATGTIKALIGRSMYSNQPPKYMVKPEGVKMPIFPLPKHVTPLNNSVCLVEGIFDALNLIDKGMENVICCFGTQQLDRAVIAEKLMPYRILGVEKIFLLLDGDEAGRKAAARLKEVIIHNTDFLVDIIPLAEGTDPGDMSLQDVQSLKKHLQNL